MSRARLVPLAQVLRLERRLVLRILAVLTDGSLGARILACSEPAATDAFCAQVGDEVGALIEELLAAHERELAELVVQGSA